MLDNNQRSVHTDSRTFALRGFYASMVVSLGLLPEAHDIAAPHQSYSYCHAICFSRSWSGDVQSETIRTGRVQNRDRWYAKTASGDNM